LFVICFFYCQSCQDNKRESEISFYHWKSSINLKQSEMDYLDSLKVKKLYVRFFDVHWDRASKEVIPISVLQWNHFDPGHQLEIVPVVFISNISLEKKDYDKGINILAKNIAKKLEQMLSELDSVRFLVNEIQLDCDWSMSTQSKYFRLIELIKKEMKDIKTFSATIRLHQVRYFTTTGVPPVDKGVLMFYNMGELTKYSEKNSILNINTAKKYLENFELYPLKLDLALPLFSWGVQFRENKIIQIINDLSASDLGNKEKFKNLGNGRFEVLKSDYLKGIYLYKNDVIKLEAVEVDDLKTSIKMVDQVFKKKDYNIIYYHLNESISHKFKPNLVREISEH